ncbi:MAG: alpha/beta hydrolase [Rubrivivax sp.]|nr:alpha/beta hydrolase [Rubrivivax sp.]
MTQPLLQATDLRGAARLTTDAVTGLTRLVEAMHARIASPPRWPRAGGAAAADERTRGITRLVYGSVRGVTRLVGGSADALFAWLTPILAAPDPQQPPRPEREAVLAALNGIVGDYLDASGNPLALSMAFRRDGQPLVLEPEALRARLTDATPRLLILLHGLCMNDLQWQRAGHDHGLALARDLGYTPLYLHYNSGRCIAANGRELALLMQRLLDAWPLPLERLALIGHSMGGLVARSAIHHGGLMQGDGLSWPERVDDLICLGSPHQGAPLERAGHGVDVLLGALPYAAPLARLGKLRSAGINDLRRGRIVGAAADEGSDHTATMRLPPGIRGGAIAASLGPAPGNLKARLLGDGLVPVRSALGRHRNPERCLNFDPDRQAVIADTGHLDLLSSAQVYQLLQQWLR